MALPRFVRIGLWVAAIGIVLAAIVGGGAAFIVWRQTTIASSQAAEAQEAFDEVKARFPQRPPLVEVRDPGPVMMDVHVNRAPESAPRQAVQFFRVLVFDARTHKLVRSRAPVWWMKFSAENLLASAGVRLGDLALTVADVERYGPGIVLDFTPPAGGRVLIWVE